MRIPDIFRHAFLIFFLFKDWNDSVHQNKGFKSSHKSKYDRARAILQGKVFLGELDYIFLVSTN